MFSLVPHPWFVHLLQSAINVKWVLLCLVQLFNGYKCMGCTWEGVCVCVSNHALGDSWRFLFDWVFKVYCVWWNKQTSKEINTKVILIQTSATKLHDIRCNKHSNGNNCIGHPGCWHLSRLLFARNRPEVECATSIAWLNSFLGL